MRRLARPLSVSLPALLIACMVRSGSVEMIERPELEPPQLVASPMKAFLTDGSTAVFPQGAQIYSDSILGRGTLYSVGLTDTVSVEALGLDDIVGIEAFQTSVDVPASVLGTLGGAAIATVGTAALMVAIFGSCPTFYAPSDQGMVLEAEAFSYSIAPLLEGRDLDAMTLAHEPDGTVRLELRNEALETHYINHLELVSVDHPVGARVVSDDRERPVAVVADATPLRAVDRGGRDVSDLLRARDDEAFASTEERIRAATGSDAFDAIELEFPAPNSDEAVVVLRLRNSLLTTVLFYDLMLDRADARAVDWIGRDMGRIGSVVELGKWFQESMGMRVEVHDGGRWVQAGRVPDTGPIAWEEVGVVVPVVEADRVRVRLRFFTDAWRIDRVSLASPAELRRTVRVPVARALQGGEALATEVVDRLARPDDAYLTTYPGTSAELVFDAPPVLPGAERSYLLASQGYYTEWVRPHWIRSDDGMRVFRPGRATVEELMALWMTKKEAFEADFHDSRIPVR